VKRLLAALWAACSSRVLSLLVLGFFFLFYIGIAFFSEETLTILIALTSTNRFLAAILALLPLNSACRIIVEGARYLERRRALNCSSPGLSPALFDETVELPAYPELAGLEPRLAAEGYRTAARGDFLAAWRGVSLAPARILFQAGTFCLFAGILVSLVGRTVDRQPVVEGMQFPAPSGSAGLVQRIVLKKVPGWFLANELTMEVAEPGTPGRTRELGVYPPSLFAGAFVYPRYLGVALRYRFLAPDLPRGYDKSDVFPLYPPGKESVVVVPDSPYKITLSLAKPEDGSDPYVTGRMDFAFKLLKGSDLLFEGSIPAGGEFVRDGVRFAIPDARRMVITDFVVDYGVLLIWGAGLIFTLAVLAWLPVRLFFPRREMLFKEGEGATLACSYAEGRIRKHAGVFHEVLDRIAAGRSASREEG
jgi:hypothetical protein